MNLRQARAVPGWPPLLSLAKDGGGRSTGLCEEEAAKKGLQVS